MEEPTPTPAHFNPARTSAANAALPPARLGPALFPGLITREQAPLNLELPFPTLAERVVPTNQFYVRNHFPIPAVEAASWQLSLEGEVEHALHIGYEELRSLPLPP